MHKQLKRSLAASLDELQEAVPRIVTIEGRSIGIIRSNDKIYAVRNLCPHKRAPVCRGLVKGTMLPSEPDQFVFGLENRVLQCPWHGWEFDLETGQAMCHGSKGRLTFYPTEIEDGKVYVLT